jgi:hypothetical protein
MAQSHPAVYIDAVVLQGWSSIYRQSLRYNGRVFCSKHKFVFSPMGTALCMAVCMSVFTTAVVVGASTSPDQGRCRLIPLLLHYLCASDGSGVGFGVLGLVL